MGTEDPCPVGDASGGVAVESKTVNAPLADELGCPTVRKNSWHNTFSFDFSIWRLLPRIHLRAPSANPRIQIRVPDDPRIRRTSWAQYGRAMHFLNLEFDDADAEQGFKDDYMQRNKGWLEYAILWKAVFDFMVASWSILLRDSTGKMEFSVQLPCSIGLLCLLQYLQIIIDRDFVYKQFQLVFLFWALAQATCINVFVWFIAPGMYPLVCDSSANVDQVRWVQTAIMETITSFSIMALIIYRMRFLYYLYVALWLIFGYCGHCLDAALTHGISSPCAFARMHTVHLVVLLTGLVFLSFTMEVMQRKDFVQAEMVFEEQKRSDEIREIIVPVAFIKQLPVTDGSRNIAQSYSSVTVLFAEIVSFSQLPAQLSAHDLVSFLESILLLFDDLAVQAGVQHIKTIGDCYMAAAGLLVADPNHAKTMARFGLAMLSLVGSSEFKNPITHAAMGLRVGLHSGPCFAGIIGHKKLALDIWGDTVSTASWLVSNGEPLKLHCSADTYKLVAEEFVCERQSVGNFKHKAGKETYFIVSDKVTMTATGTGRDALDPVREASDHSFVVESDDAQKNDIINTLGGTARRLARNISTFGQDDGDERDLRRRRAPSWGIQSLNSIKRDSHVSSGVSMVSRLSPPVSVELSGVRAAQ